MSKNDVAPSQVILLECNLDDMSGEALGYALERILDSGALEAWYSPVYMKKNRPGVVLSVLSRSEDAARLLDLIMRETTTLGVRRRLVERIVAERQTIIVETRWGPVRCKIKSLEGSAIGLKPEYDDCAEIARQNGIPLAEVEHAARLAGWHSLRSD